MPWSHTSPLFEDYEIEVLNEVVTFTPPNGAVVSYAASTDHDQSLYTVNASPAGITVATVNANLRGLYPNILVRYLTAEYVQEEITTWDVPSGARMTGFDADPVKEYTFSIECQCNWIDSNSAPQVANISLAVTIWQHYNFNSEILRQKIAEEDIG